MIKTRPAVVCEIACVLFGAWLLTSGAEAQDVAAVSPEEVGPATEVAPAPLPAPEPTPPVLAPEPSPPPVTRPTATADVTSLPESRPRSRSFKYGYVTVAAMISFGGKGGFSVSELEDDDDGGEVDGGSTSTDIDGNSNPQFGRGTHLGVYLVPSPFFHIGMFLDSLDGRVHTDPSNEPKKIEDGKLYNWGLALKAGGLAGRAFIGFAIDLGVASALGDDQPVQHGLWIHPRLQVDILVAREHSLKGAISMGLGPTVNVTAGDYDASGDLFMVRWAVAPAITLGGSLGG